MELESSESILLGAWCSSAPQRTWWPCNTPPVLKRLRLMSGAYLPFGESSEGFFFISISNVRYPLLAKASQRFLKKGSVKRVIMRFSDELLWMPLKNLRSFLGSPRSSLASLLVGFFDFRRIAYRALYLPSSRPRVCWRNYSIHCLGFSL